MIVSLPTSEIAAARYIDRQSLPLYLLIASTWAIITAGCIINKIAISSDLLIIIIAAIIVSWTAMCLRFRGAYRLAALVESFVIFNIICISFILLSYVLSINSIPLADIKLSAIDGFLFPYFNWEYFLIELCKHDFMLRCAIFAYSSPAWQIIVLLILFYHKNEKMCWDFVMAWAIALSVTMIIFPFIPAVDPYIFYGVSHDFPAGMVDHTGWHATEFLIKLRAGQVTHLGSDTLTGIVTFPSFHAAAAILFGWGFWSNRWARWPFAALNAMMFVSAVPIGGHYIIDVIGGAGVASIAIYSIKKRRLIMAESAPLLQ